MNNFQKVLRNTFFLSSAELFVKILGLLWIIYLGNVLTVSLYGRYSFINSFITIFSFLPEFGIGLIVVREIARNKEKAYQYVSNAFFINFIIGIVTICLLLTAGLVFEYPKDILLLLLLGGGTLFFASLRAAPLYYFEGTENMKIAAVLTVLNTLFLIGGAMGGYYTTLSLHGLFFGMLIGTITSLVVCYITFLWNYKMPKVVFNLNQMLGLIKHGYPLAVASFSYLIYTRVESIVLKQLLGEHAVGIYNSATPFVFSLIQLFNLPFVVALYPTLSKLFTQDRTRFNKALGKSLLVIAIWSFPLSFAVYYSAPHMLPIVFGDKFEQGIPVLQHLIFFLPFASLSALLYKVLIIFNKQKIYMVINIAGACIDIALNIFFIKSYGIIGAAYGAVLTQVILCMVYGMVVYILVKNNKKV